MKDFVVLQYKNTIQSTLYKVNNRKENFQTNNMYIYIQMKSCSKRIENWLILWKNKYSRNYLHET